MLAMVDRDGLVLASIPGLAKRANISLIECEAGLAKFQQPDPYSQSQVAEGRRVEVVPGGWHLINYDTYRHQLSAAEQRDKDRIRKAQYRLSQKSGTKRDSPEMSQYVALGPAESDIATATATATAEKSISRRFAPPTIEEVSLYCRERRNEIDPEKFHAYYESVGWKKRGGTQIKNWRSAVITWEKNNYGGQFRDGYQKTGRAEREQLGTQERRAFSNATAIFGLASEVGTDSSPDGPGQETRPDGRSYALLEGKVKTIP